MNRNRAVLTAIVIIVVIAAGWWLFRRSRSAGNIDLVAQFDAAEKRPAPSLFKVEDVTMNGETKKGISIEPTVGTRIIWKLRIPDDGWLRVAVGLKPEAWEKPGDGVLFMVGVSDGRTFEQLFTEHVDPFGNKSDRRWIPVMVDLSAYAGEETQVIFNTFAAPAGKPGNEQNDFAVWGAPQIVVR